MELRLIIPDVVITVNHHVYSDTLLDVVAALQVSLKQQSVQLAQVLTLLAEIQTNDQSDIATALNDEATKLEGIAK